MPATPAWPPKSAPRLFVEQELSSAAQVTIEGNQAHYLTRVMRVAPGDAVILCDDITGEWAAEVVEAAKRHVLLQPRDHQRPREAVPDFWLCPALLKKDRFDLVLEKATELGVDRILPVITRRCVADKLNAERAATVVTEAAEQCARTALPEVAAVRRLDTLLDEWPQERHLFFADEEGGEPAADAFCYAEGPAALTEGGKAHEVEVAETFEEGHKPANVIEAAAQGTQTGVKLAVAVGAMVMVFVALVALANGILGGVGGMFGYPDVSFQQLLGFVFAPVMYLIGIPWEQAGAAGGLFGTKIVLNEFVAFIDLGAMDASVLSDRSRAIVTFALCGFANFSSIAIQMAVTGGLAPNQRPVIAKLGLRALAAGSLANLMSAALAGLFLPY